MKTFSPSEAAFEGFRLIRSYPGAILAWTIAYILLYVGFGALAISLFGPQFTALSAYSGQNSMPPEQALGFMRIFGLGMLTAFPAFLIVGAIFINAVYRPILKPADKGLFYLKLGGDELRLALLIFIYMLLFAACEIAVVLAFVMLTLALSHTPHPVGGGWLHLVAIPVIIGLAIWIVVRLSLAASMTFARGKLDLFGSWRVTRGQFWRLLGCYILAWIFAVMIAIVGWVVSVSAGAVITGDWTALSGAMVNPRMAMMSSGLGLLTHLFTTAALVQIGLSSLISTVSRVIMYAPAAAAYRDLTAAPANGEAGLQGLML